MEQESIQTIATGDNNFNDYYIQPIYDSLKVKVKYHRDKYPNFDYIIEQHGDFLDLATAESVTLKAFEPKLISLGVSIKLPEGYWGQVVPRSSTFKKYRIMMTNSFGVIDNAYCGEGDIWHFPAIYIPEVIPTKWFNEYDNYGNIIGQYKKNMHIEESKEYIIIPANERICQFRIVKNIGIDIEEVDHMEDSDRGGFGSSDKKE